MRLCEHSHVQTSVVVWLRLIQKGGNLGGLSIHQASSFCSLISSEMPGGVTQFTHLSSKEIGLRGLGGGFSEVYQPQIPGRSEQPCFWGHPTGLGSAGREPLLAATWRKLVLA